MAGTNSHCSPPLSSHLHRNNQGPCQATTTKYVVHIKTNYTRKSAPICIDSEGDKPDTTNTFFCWAAIADTKNKTVYIDLAGKFPYCSFEGNKYIFVAYDYNSNAIIVRPMPNREAATIVSTFQGICNMLDKKQRKPQFCLLDNEASNAIKDFLSMSQLSINLFRPRSIE